MLKIVETYIKEKIIPNGDRSYNIFIKVHKTEDGTLFEESKRGDLKKIE